MKTAKKYLLLCLGCIIYSTGVSLFYIPNKIVTGGISGFSNILYHTMHLSPGATMFITNAILVIIGFRALGKTAIIDALVSNTIISVLFEVLILFPPITTDMFLATIFGAALYGAGLGICFAIGANTGGTDIIARIVQVKNSEIPIGKILLGVDGCILLASLIVFKNVDLCLCGIGAMFIASSVIDVVIKNLNVSKFVFVITDKGELLSEKLVSSSPRGVTMCEAMGAYTKTNKQVLMCALKSNEIQKFQRRVLKIDPGAFVVFTEAQQIVGKGFKVYK